MVSFLGNYMGGSFFSCWIRFFTFRISSGVGLFFEAKSRLSGKEANQAEGVKNDKNEGKRKKRP